MLHGHFFHKFFQFSEHYASLSNATRTKCLRDTGTLRPLGQPWHSTTGTLTQRRTIRVNAAIKTRAHVRITNPTNVLCMKLTTKSVPIPSLICVYANDPISLRRGTCTYYTSLRAARPSRLPWLRTQQETYWVCIAKGFPDDLSLFPPQEKLTGRETTVNNTGTSSISDPQRRE